MQIQTVCVKMKNKKHNISLSFGTEEVQYVKHSILRFFITIPQGKTNFVIHWKYASDSTFIQKESNYKVSRAHYFWNKISIIL